MFFRMIISYTYDMCLELENFNFMNTNNQDICLKKSLPLQPFGSKFQALEIFI
jgi:hypothetical protein